jgi:hypothetical protein
MPSDKEKSQSLLDALEARMRQAETFAWAVPALALTAQALLLSVVFDHSTTALGRVLASLTGLIIVLAALHLLLKHTFNFDMYEAVIERERKERGLPGVSRRELLVDAKAFPKQSGFRERDWLALEPNANWLSHARKRFISDVRAVQVWTVALMLLALIDLGVFTHYLIDALTDASFDGSSRGSAAMDTSDWIIAGIGLAQAIALGVAAIFAWKAYDAAKREREAARVERQATEGRRILQSVIDETMALAEQVEERVPAVGSQRLDSHHGMPAAAQDCARLPSGTDASQDAPSHRPRDGSEYDPDEPARGFGERARGAGASTRPCLVWGRMTDMTEPSGQGPNGH